VSSPDPSIEAIAVSAVIEGKGERDIADIEARKAQARDLVVLLQKAIKQLEGQQQLADQQRMLDQTMATIAPLTKALDDSARALALPPFEKRMQPLEPEVAKPKQTGRWFGTPREGSGRWNQRLR
jgi:hypothetical protein